MKMAYIWASFGRQPVGRFGQQGPRWRGDVRQAAWIWRMRESTESETFGGSHGGDIGEDPGLSGRP